MNDEDYDCWYCRDTFCCHKCCRKYNILSDVALQNLIFKEIDMNSENSHQLWAFQELQRRRVTE